jgi:anti-sigma28 factor (negative regulator of flagellin synthesis)
MDLQREMKMQELRERIEHDDYRVDPNAVAGAIVERLLAGVRRDDTAGTDERA